MVLVDCAGGGELGLVRDALAGPLATPVIFLERAELTSLPIALDLSAGLLQLGDGLVRPAVTWVRHGSACAIAAHAQPAGSVRLLAAAGWSGFFERLAGLAAAALPGNAPAGPDQLLDAERLGIRAPRTVLSTDVAAAAQLVGSSRVIAKTPDFRLFEPDHRQWPASLPTVLDAGASVAGVAESPVFVQEYLPYERELRVYFLNGAVCAFEVDKAEPASMWTDPDSVRVSLVSCPQPAAEAVRSLSARWGLRFGAFDLLVTETGEPVFLEVNPDGDWLWYERKAGWHGISFMAAVMVRELFVRHTS